MAEALDGIAEIGNAPFFRQRRQAVHILENAGFVVYRLDRDQARMGVDGFFHRFHRDAAVFVRGHIGNGISLLFQLTQRFQHGFMFCSGGNNVPFTGKAQGQGPVIGLCAAGSEEDFLLPCIQQAGNGPPGLLQDPPGMIGRAMHGPGIAEGFGHHLTHPLRHLGIGRRGGGIVQIDHGDSPFFFFSV